MILKFSKQFFFKKKVWRYKLVIENFDIQNDIDKSDKVVVYEEGEANVDNDLNILFIPDSNPTGSYTSYFENEKQNFKVSLPKIYALAHYANAHHLASKFY